MKKFALFLIVLSFLVAPALIFAQDAQEEAEEAGEATEQAAEETGEAVEEGAEEAGQEVEEAAEEAGEAVEEAAEDVEQAAEGAAETAEQLAEQPGVDPGVVWGGVVRLTQLTGLGATNDAGDLQGQFEDVVISTGGDLAFFAISSAEGEAGNWYLVPHDRLTGVNEDGLVFNVTRDEFQGFGTVASDSMEMAMSDETTLGAEIDDYILGSRLIGWMMINQQDEELGTVEDIVLDVAQGLVEYAAVSTSEMLGLTDRYLAIGQTRWVDFDMLRDALVVDIDDLALRDERGFPPEGQWPITGTSDFE